MKKILKLVVVFGLVVSVIGCTPGNLSTEEANTAYNAMIQAQQKMDSVKMDGSLAATVDGGGVKIDLKAQMNSVIEAVAGDSPKMSVKVSMDMFGQKMLSEKYYADGMEYSNSNGDKTSKEAISTDEYLTNVNPLSAIDLSIFDNFTAKKIDGDYVFAVSISQKEIAELMGLFAPSLPETSGIDITKFNFIITSDATTNQLKSITGDFEVSAEVDGQKMAASASVNLNYSDYGAAKVELPSDLDAYTDAYDYEEVVYDLSHITDTLKYYDADEYTVGKDIEAGEYIVYAKSDLGGMIFVGESIAREDYAITALFDHKVIVTLSKGQVADAYEAILVSIDDVTEIDATQPGMYKVGLHLPAGTYTLTAEADDSLATYAIVDQNDAFDLNDASEYIDESVEVTLKNGQYIFFEGATLATK